MTYVITEACIDIKDKSCIDVCPVDCIITEDQDRMVYINPDECIDCGACVDPCPVEAIYAEEDLPEKLTQYTALNAKWFEDKDAVRSEVDALKQPDNG